MFRNFIIGVAVVATLAPFFEAKADESTLAPFLTVQVSESANGVVTENRYQITDDLRLKPQSDGSLLIISSDNNVSLPLSEVRSVGIVYDYLNSISGIGEEDAGDSLWTILSLDGKVVASGRGNAPDFSLLEKNTVFVVSHGSRSYKYIKM